MSLICANEQLKGIGETCKQATPLTALSGVIFTLADYEFASLADFADETKWKEGIASGKIFPVQGVYEREGQDVEDAILESSTGDKVFQYEGRRGQMLKFVLTLDQHKLLRQYSHLNLRYFKVDRNNNICGTTPDGVKVKGFRIPFIFVGKMETPSSDAAALTPVTIQEGNVNEWDRNGVYVNPEWFATDLHGTLHVEATPSSIVTNAFSVTVAYVDGSQLQATGAKSSVAITGLLADNFRVIDQTGAVVAAPVVTESATIPGTYSVTASGMTSGTVQVVATADNLYKSDVELVTA